MNYLKCVMTESMLWTHLETTKPSVCACLEAVNCQCVVTVLISLCTRMCQYDAKANNRLCLCLRSFKQSVTCSSLFNCARSKKVTTRKRTWHLLLKVLGAHVAQHHTCCRERKQLPSGHAVSDTPSPKKRKKKTSLFTT